MINAYSNLALSPINSILAVNFEAMLEIYFIERTKKRDGEKERKKETERKGEKRRKR